MSPARTPEQRPPVRRPHGRAAKKCSGPCGRTLPLSSFHAARGRADGKRSECKECRRGRIGARGKEGQQARALQKELWVLREQYSAIPSLADILNRAYEEVSQVGVPGAKFDEQVLVVRRAIDVGGCRTSAEIVEDTGLSRWVVERALERLVDSKVVETRDSFRLEDASEEPGRPPTEYHPVDSPRGELFTHILYRAVDDDLL